MSGGEGFTEYQQDILKTIASSSAFLSTIAWIAVLLFYATIPRVRTPSFRLIALLISCNGMSSAALLIDLGNGSTIDGQSHALCVSTAAMLHFFDVAAFCWTFCVAFHVFATLRYDKGIRHIQLVYHGVSWGVPLLGVVAGFGMSAFGDAGNWCWIKPEFELLRLIAYYIPLAISLIGCLILFSKTSRLLSSESFGAPPHLATAMRARFGLYVTAFAVLQAFSVANRTQDAIKGHSPVFALYVMHSLATPLQGFVNTAVYGLNRLVWQHLLALWEGCGCVRVTHTRGAHIGGGGEGERTSLLDTSVEGEYRRVVTSAHKQPLVPHGNALGGSGLWYTSNSWNESITSGGLRSHRKSRRPTDGEIDVIAEETVLSIAADSPLDNSVE